MVGVAAMDQCRFQCVAVLDANSVGVTSVDAPVVFADVSVINALLVLRLWMFLLRLKLHMVPFIVLPFLMLPL